MTNQAIPEGNGGWIKLHRRFLDSREFGSNPATFKVCIYLMLAANHKLRYVRGIKVERGQCIRSLSMISDDCSLSRKAVRCALGNLERSGFIHVDAPFGAQQGHRVSVCNYATYQGEEADGGTEGISEGYHEGNTNKNGKKEKKVRQQELLPPDGGASAGKKPRERNPLMDALGMIDAPDLNEIDGDGWKRAGVALSKIKSVAPDVTPEEIARRGRNYRTHFDGAALTSTALAKYWAMCRDAKSNGATVNAPVGRMVM